MIECDDVTEDNKYKKHNPEWIQIPDHSYRILIIGNSRIRKKMHYII